MNTQQIFPFSRVGWYGKRPIDGRQLREHRRSIARRAALIENAAKEGSMETAMICKNASDIPHLTEGKEYDVKPGAKPGFVKVRNDAGIWVAVWAHRFVETEEVAA